MDFKKNYVEMRNKGEYNLRFFFDYFMHKTGVELNPEEFTEKFMYEHTEHPSPPGFPPIIIRNGEIDREKVLNFMDGVFGLTILNNKQGQFIKVVE